MYGGPPSREFHVDLMARSRTCHTVAALPLHWQQMVQLTFGELLTWCHRMVVTRKHDDIPCRNVDLLHLNIFCQYETFATESPFQLASCISVEQCVDDCPL